MATTTQDLTTLQPQPEPRAPSAPRWRLVALSLLLVVACAEVGARTLASRLPPIDHWNQREAAQMYDQMRALSAAGGVDAVFVGSSVAHFGFEPAQFTRITGMSAYNAALPGSGAIAVEQWTRDFVLPMLKPKLVMIGLTSRDLNDNGPVQAEHLQSYLSSEGRRRALGLATPGERIERFIEDRSALVRIRRYLRTPASVAKQLRGQDALVRIVNLGAHGEARFPEADYAFSNDAQRQAWEREALQNFDMTRSIASLKALITTLRSPGIDVVVVDMPVLEEIYVPFHANGRADMEAYRAALGTLGAPIVRIDGARFSPQRHLVDSIHLNRAGARAFSRTLASRLAAR